MTEDLRVFLATIYGESASCSFASWQAIASVIMNRVGVREWRNFRTPLRVIVSTGFDAFIQQNIPYKIAYDYFADDHPPALTGKHSRMDNLRKAVEPIYTREAAPITDAVLYYSPRAQAALHRQFPRRYVAIPKWNFDKLDRVDIPGIGKDDFAFYRYKIEEQIV